MAEYPLIFEIEEARNILRVDGNDNDDEIYRLIFALPPYLYHTTGYKPTDGNYSYFAKAAAGFILWQWYYGENSDVNKTQRVIDNLLKALSAERANDE